MGERRTTAPNDGRSPRRTRSDPHLDRATRPSTVQRVAPLSPRLKAIVDALPLRPGLRVIEIGCGPGAAAREVVERVGASGHVLAVDRSAKAIALLTESAAASISAGRLTPRQVAVEELELEPGEDRYDVAFAIRVGAFDGRDPTAGSLALARLGRALVPGGRLFIDGGDPLQEIDVPRPTDEPTSS
jgi:SAM-dependent methyltransferase